MFERIIHMNLSVFRSANDMTELERNEHRSATRCAWKSILLPNVYTQRAKLFLLLQTRTNIAIPMPTP
jgi:hypothetical protein